VALVWHWSASQADAATPLRAVRRAIIKPAVANVQTRLTAGKLSEFDAYNERSFLGAAPPVQLLHRPFGRYSAGREARCANRMRGWQSKLRRTSHGAATCSLTGSSKLRASRARCTPICPNRSYAFFHLRPLVNAVFRFPFPRP
jgi:hypothetical protein